MKSVLYLALLFTFATLPAQNIQLHYDFRHTAYPKLSAKNFPTFNFEYYKTTDTARGNSFFLKVQTDFSGKDFNPGQLFSQASYSFRAWKPKLFMGITYSGGLGVAEPNYGYYIPNSFGLGLSYPMKWNQAYISLSLYFRYNAFVRPSYDPQCTLYFGRGFFNYRIYADGSFVFWTQNKNTGNESTATLTGKKFSFYGDPKVWVRVWRKVSLGTRIMVYYNILGDPKSMQFFPTMGVKFEI